MNLDPSQPASIVRTLQRIGIRNAWQKGLAVLHAHWYLRQANSIGLKVRVWGRPVVKNKGTMNIGDRFRLV